MRRFGVIIAIGLVGVSACGGSSHSSTTTRTSAASAERTRLENQLRSALQAPSSPVAGVTDLDECIVQQADTLPLSQLRQLVASHLGNPVGRLVGRCVTAGKGLSWARGLIIKEGAGKLPPPIPVAYKKCAVAGVSALGAKPLGAAFTHAASGDESYTRRVGEQIGFACLHKPVVFDQFRGVWVGSIRRALQGRHLPAAFVQCVLDKAGQIHADQLVKLVRAGSAAENAYGQKLGRACRAAITG